MRALLILAVLPLIAAERAVDPTFLHRYLPDVREQKAEISTPTCHYKPPMMFCLLHTNSRSSVPTNGRRQRAAKRAFAFAPFPF
jgi:hypothetical protein